MDFFTLGFVHDMLDLAQHNLFAYHSGAILVPNCSL